MVYDVTARYYDKIYAFKDFPAEAERLLSFIRKLRPQPGGRLLDVACGTGAHLVHLREHYEVEGLDLSAVMLETARKKLPGVAFHEADMTDFELGRRFDVVTCLFSSIGYVVTGEKLHRAVGCMARHLVPGGVLALEPWFTPERWNVGKVHLLTVDEPELKIARVSTSFVEGRLSYFDLHYLVATPGGTEYGLERHEMGLFEREEIVGALRAAGLEPFYDAQGLDGRGLHLGLKK
ncbi:MAG: methyltransferase domain-containing protein [bacterium]|nr:methyltransferase domain-containing protein [bacterium]